MLHRSVAVLLCSAFCSALAVPAPARAAGAPALKPLRTLVYAVSYSARTRNEEHTSGFSGAGGAIGTGNAAVERSSTADDHGTLTVDIIAATGDGGLVADTTWDGANATQRAIRVAITRNGNLTYDPRQPLSIEAARVLPLLARGFIAERDVSPGATWSTPVAAPAKGTTSYRVTAQTGQSTTMAVDASLDVPGTRGYSESDTGTMVYATDRLCPTMVDLVMHERHTPAPEQFVSTDAHLTASLTRDSFAARGA